MNNSLGQKSIQVLVRPYKDKYISMCLEMGLYFEEDTFEEAKKSMFSSMSLLLDSAEEDETLLPSLSVGMPFHYSVFFRWSVFLYHARSFIQAMQQALVVQGDAYSIRGLAACG